VSALLFLIVAATVTVTPETVERWVFHVPSFVHAFLHNGRKNAAGLRTLHASICPLSVVGAASRLRGLMALCPFLILVVPAGAQEAAEEDNAEGVRKTLREEAISRIAAKTLAETPKKLAEGVQAFFAADLGDTDVRIDENRKKEFEKLAKKFDGREIILAFRSGISLVTSVIRTC